MRETIEARQAERDEWIVAIWQVWPEKRGNIHSGETWEAVNVLARVPTPNGDPEAIERAKAIAECLREDHLRRRLARAEDRKRAERERVRRS